MSLSKIKTNLNRTIENISQNWESLINRSRKALTKFTGESQKEQNGEDKVVLQQWNHVYGLGLIPVDVYEEKDMVFVRVEVPGMSENDLSIQLIGSELFINGNKKIKREQRKEQFHLMECAYGTFQRVIDLPCLVDDTKAEASCKNGILTIKFSKKYPSDKKLISIK